MVNHDELLLCGFVELYCSWPAFVYPIFTDGTKYFFEDGCGKFIEHFHEFAIDTIPASRIYHLCNQNHYFHIGSPTVYAFQEHERSEPFWGDSNTFLPFLFCYQTMLSQSGSYNQNLLSEVNGIIWDILFKNGVLNKDNSSARIGVRSSSRLDSYRVMHPTHIYPFDKSDPDFQIIFDYKNFSDKSALFQQYSSYCSPIIEHVRRRYVPRNLRGIPFNISAIILSVMSASTKTISDMLTHAILIDQMFNTDQTVFSINQIIKDETISQTKKREQKHQITLSSDKNHK